MQKVKELERLQVHYYLSDYSHSMDAKILNRVELELIKIAEEVSRILDLEMYIETQALEEGGIKSIYNFVCNTDKTKLLLVGTFFAGILSTVLSDVIADKIKTDPQMEKLKKQQIELQIKKLKQDIIKDSIETNKSINLPNQSQNDVVINQQLIDNLSIYLAENNKIKISKSKFYEFLLKEEKVKKVSTQVFNQDKEAKSKENFVPRSDFKYFIITEAEIEPEYKESVSIEIVSPVLDRSRLNWRAIYNGETMSFKLKDKEFSNLIINKNLKFSNGTKIICDIETKLKMNNDGEILKLGNSVYNVTQIIYPDGDVVDIIHE